ncbi:ApeA N-terminal domain 1-containing protein [Marinilactibacillus psychrotolerans]|uniref:ApeA N-terminal domain 1-containing protein n=1 Tax=Marinilactibacillus psychrotolerans TaxID=191770 RepID=UPI00388A4AAD
MKKYDKNSTMLDNFELRGLWYLPDSKLEDGIYGTLTFTSSMISLKLMDNFIDFFDSNNLVNDRVILGFSENGKHIYLDNCFIIKQTNNIPGIGMSEYQVNTMFLSSQPISSIDNLPLTQFTFSFAHYDKWDKSSPLEIFRNTKEKSVSINYSREKLKSIESSYNIENNTMVFSKRAVVTHKHIDGFIKMEISFKKNFEAIFSENMLYYL